MEGVKLSDDVIDQIIDFEYWNLTEEQKVLIDELILNEELKECYKENGLCEECRQPKISYLWCQLCEFQQNFKNWTSGNCVIDEFIRKAQLKAKNEREILEWIEFDRFKNVEFLAKGGFGITYKAIWKDGYVAKWDPNYKWMRRGEIEVALKCLHNSQDITVEFLREIESHIALSNSDDIVQCFGITKDPKTKNFMMVMVYANNGSLRQHLNNNFNLFNWNEKLINLYLIAFGLEIIHNKGLIHHDFHCGNILIHKNEILHILITDLGLCKPANSQSCNGKIYGVLPYVAPEVLRGKEYTQASDIYGFGVVAYEVCTGTPPYRDIAHDEYLAVKICQGLRPKSNYKVPKLILDLINQCWDADPLKRPNAEELKIQLWRLYEDARYKENLSINNQIKEADEINKNLPSLTAVSSSISIPLYTTHTRAVYTSRHLDFKFLPEPKNADNETEFSESTMMDFTKININSKVSPNNLATKLAPDVDRASQQCEDTSGIPQVASNIKVTSFDDLYLFLFFAFFGLFIFHIYN